MEAIRKAGYYTAFILPGLVVLGYSLGGWWHMITPFYVFVFLPLSDQLLGIDKRNVEEERMAGVAKESYYKFVLYHWTWLQLAFVGWGFYVVTSGRLQLPQEWIGFTLSFALVTGGVGITVAHELGHKKEAIKRFYSKLLLMTVSYMHFYIEHHTGNGPKEQKV